MNHITYESDYLGKAILTSDPPLDNLNLKSIAFDAAMANKPYLVIFNSIPSRKELRRFAKNFYSLLGTKLRNYHYKQTAKQNSLSSDTIYRHLYNAFRFFKKDNKKLNYNGKKGYYLHGILIKYNNELNSVQLIANSVSDAIYYNSSISIIPFGEITYD